MENKNFKSLAEYVRGLAEKYGHDFSFFDITVREYIEYVKFLEAFMDETGEVDPELIIEDEIEGGLTYEGNSNSLVMINPSHVEEIDKRKGEIK